MRASREVLRLAAGCFWCCCLFALVRVAQCDDLFDGFKAKQNGLSTLRSDLLNGYKASARPVKDHTTNTTVKIALSLNSLNMDDHAQQMSVVTFLKIKWNDEFLRWDPVANHNINSLHFDQEEIWMPDIALFNSAKSSSISPTSTLPVVGSSDGNMTWVPPFSAQVPCSMDIASWPSDTHTCHLRFGSWAHHGQQINVELTDADNPIFMQMYEVNKKWTLLNYTANKEYSEYENEIYISIDFKFTVKREAASHAAYVTQTTFAVMLVILGSYLLPLSYHLSRFLLHLFSLCILITCNFALFLSLPATGGSVPHVVKYFSGAIILTTLSLLCNVMIATSMTSSFTLQKLLKKMDLARKAAPSPTELESNEIAYSALEEDSASISSTFTREEPRNVPSQKESEAADTHRIIRLLNGVLFVMFFLAFVIDYSVLRNNIGY